MKRFTQSAGVKKSRIDPRDSLGSRIAMDRDRSGG
jgi:hypothetical protein